MADNKGAVIFLAIIAVAAAGLSGYSFVTDILTEDVDYVDDDSYNLKLVALWEDLDENLTNNPLHSLYSNFLIEYNDQVLLNTEYVNVVNNTRFNLLIPGLYKINIAVLLGGLTDVDRYYWIDLIVNNTVVGYFERYGSANPVIDTYYYVKGNLYINNTSSENYYEIVARSSSSLASFNIATDPSTPYFNQLSIEYVIE
ncbi:MAG: hypothetical protein ACTSRE_12695 [Promethearchaeota archaeon]